MIPRVCFITKKRLYKTRLSTADNAEAGFQFSSFFTYSLCKIKLYMNVTYIYKTIHKIIYNFQVFIKF